ncbi:hypothetical protein D917_06004, partial [Trichinella nativa]
MYVCTGAADGAEGVVAERLKTNQSKNITHSSIRLALASSEKLLKGVDCGIDETDIGGKDEK